MLDLILLQSQATSGAANNGMSSIIMIVALIAIFYFFMIRPQSKKQKEMRKFRDAMSKGDSVTTAGGIHGKIREVKESTIILEIADGVKITIDKSMVYPSAQDVVESGVDVKTKQ